jgi:diguanylate cyclase (GGDEF)-like protein
MVSSRSSAPTVASAPSQPGGATPAPGEGPRREICCSMTSVLLRTVRTLKGEAGVNETLVRAGSEHDVGFLENVGNWISLDQAVALLEAGIQVTGDAQLARQVGEQAVRQHAGTQVATLLRSLGSPEAVLRGIMTTAAKFSTVSELEAIETGASHAVVRARAREGFDRHPLMCDWAKGLLSQPCVLFGLPPARVEEIECQARGGSECRYVISWDKELAEAAADPEQRVTALEAQVVAMSQRLESVYATASDLVSPDDLDTVLARIVERAADAVRAPGYVLVVRPDPVGEPLVLREGVSAEEADRVVSSLTDASKQPSGMLCVEVESSRRRYGHLFALQAVGMGFFPQEKQLLTLYAKHAAAVLDIALALQESSRRHEHVSALLSLSQALADADTAQDVARLVTNAMIDLVGCDQSSIWLWDGATSCLRRECTAGAPSKGRRIRLDRHETPHLAQMLRDPQPKFFDDEENDPVLTALMTDAGLVAMVVVPIIARGAFLAVLTVGVRHTPERLQRSADLLKKLTGVAALAAPALQNRHLIDELGHQVLHDGLTAVLNRTGFNRSLGTILAGEDEASSRAGLLFIDIDGFKELNDTHGHQVGDELLRELAKRLRKTFRADDAVARLGGDEFAVILPGLGTSEEVHAAALRVQASVAARFRVNGLIVQLRLSVGEAVSPTHGTTIDQLVKHADSNMYRCKAERRAVVRAPA